MEMVTSDPVLTHYNPQLLLHGLLHHMELESLCHTSWQMEVNGQLPLLLALLHAREGGFTLAGERRSPHDGTGATP